MLDLRGWMKNSGREMSVNLAVCDEEVGARLRSLSVLDIIVHLHTPIFHNSSRSMGYLSINTIDHRVAHFAVFLQSPSKLLNQPHCCSNLEAHPPVDLHQVILCGNLSIFL